MGLGWAWIGAICGVGQFCVALNCWFGDFVFVGILARASARSFFALLTDGFDGWIKSVEEEATLIDEESTHSNSSAGSQVCCVD